MDPGIIATTRLVSQQLALPRFASVRALVGWMGAMQAQDFDMAKWAVGARLTRSTASAIQGAIDAGDIIRTHLLRPTWHFVAAEDLRWILALTAPHINSSLTATHKTLGLGARAASRSNAVIEKALTGRNYLTREELFAALRRARIPLPGIRSHHVLVRAELDGVICSGPSKQGKQTYALIDERVPDGRRVSRESALEMLARRYFTSHAPATLEDFRWWSGLPAADAGRALELAGPIQFAPTGDGRTHWIARMRSRHLPDGHPVHVLPAYDEFLISYRNRSASLPAGHYANVVSTNGIFRPVIVVGGQVVGLWKRTTVKNTLMLEGWLFSKLSGSVRGSIGTAFTRYARFVGKRAQLTFKGERGLKQL